MATVTVRNLPDEVHRALRVRAAHHGRSTEAEIRSILDLCVRTASRPRLGSLLRDIAQEAGALSEAEVSLFNQTRDKTPAGPLVFK